MDYRKTSVQVVITKAGTGNSPDEVKLVKRQVSLFVVNYFGNSMNKNNYLQVFVKQ